MKKKTDKKRNNLDAIEKNYSKALNDMHAAVIDEYFINGFNATQAMLTVNPNLKYNTAAVMANEIMTDERNILYLQEKRSRLRASTDIRNENLVRELMNWAYCDVTQFMTLTEKEIKDLPADLKRCIQSFKSYEKTSIDRNGTKHHTKTLEIKMVDKKTAMDAIAKHIGFYLLDNEQKRTKINLQKVDATILNGFLEAIEYQDMESGDN